MADVRVTPHPESGHMADIGGRLKGAKGLNRSRGRIRCGDTDSHG